MLHTGSEAMLGVLPIRKHSFFLPSMPTTAKAELLRRTKAAAAVEGKANCPVDQDSSIKLSPATHSTFQPGTVQLFEAVMQTR
jgi:hypothetical protein